MCNLGEKWKRGVVNKSKNAKIEIDLNPPPLFDPYHPGLFRPLTAQGGTLPPKISKTAIVRALFFGLGSLGKMHILNVFRFLVSALREVEISGSRNFENSRNSDYFFF